MPSNNQKAVLLLGVALASTTALYLLSKASSTGSSKDGSNNGVDSTDLSLKQQSSEKTHASLAKTELNSRSVAATSPAIVLDATSEGTKASVSAVVVDDENQEANLDSSNPAVDDVAILKAKRDGPQSSEKTKVLAKTETNSRSIHATYPAIVLDATSEGTKASESVVVVDDENQEPDLDPGTVQTTMSNQAVDVGAILKAKKNTGKNIHRTKAKSSAASAAIKELNSSAQQKGKTGKKKKSKGKQ